MTLAQIFTIIILAAYPFLFAAMFWFFKIGELQRQTLLQFAPLAVRSVKDKPLSREAKIELATALLAEAFKSSHLPPCSRLIIRQVIEAELGE